ncbi:MAG: amidohydrolase family protein [Bacteroidota bacterium]
MKNFFKILLCLVLPVISNAQETFPINGVNDDRLEIYALTNATIHKDYQTVIEQATLLIEKGTIKAVGKSVEIPKGAVVIDMNGKIIMPSFIDPYTNYGLPKPKRSSGVNWNGPEIVEPRTKGPYNANDAINSDYNAIEDFSIKIAEAKKMRSLGFGSVLSFYPDGIARGSSALVSLADSEDNLVVLEPKVATHYSLQKGSSSQTYPISLMGSVALLRQTFYDAQWYSKTGKNQFFDQTLESMNANNSLPKIFEAKNKLSVFRAEKIAEEFGIQFLIKGTGEEYQQLEEIRKMKSGFILPVYFPETYKVDDPFEARDINLEDLKHWELAPYNPYYLDRNGIEFSFTTYDLKKKKDLWENLKKVHKAGLSKEKILKALTYNPARQLNVSSQVGTLDPGKTANFLVSEGNFLEPNFKILQNWVQGKKYEINEPSFDKLAGKYELKVGNTSYELEIEEKKGKLSAHILENDTLKKPASIKFGSELINLSFSPDSTNKKIRLSGWYSNESRMSLFKGKGQLQTGAWVEWSATLSEEASSEENKSDKESKEEEPGKVIYPFAAFGNEAIPGTEKILFKNATVWTNESEGILENADVLIENGKIAQIGKNLEASGAKTVDATGLHLTSGIIDEHSHIALQAVNDVATNSSMVRMEDVVDPNDVDIYRQLAGGVTAAQLLHGSANPIGGQSALIKFRWGKSADDLLIKNADGYIKFALGENVKRSRNASSIRYPQTRMGVEQVYVDAFTQAKAYKKAWDGYNKVPEKRRGGLIAPRKVLDLEPLKEILDEERFISCHSYVQSEINMLMHVADDFDFKVNTFTHILEGYKVADKMAEHGAGGSTFADWWAYKYEVIDAIPYNPALMHDAGVVVAVNSDDAEMARRLNQEAAKSVKYADMSEEDAWKLVTLNPAKLLHLDDRMGSIKVGKDADLVLWSDHPLSIYAKAEKTIVDGVIYYDREKDVDKRKWLEKERNRLIQKMKNDPASKNGKKPNPKINLNLHCDDLIFTQN